MNAAGLNARVPVCEDERFFAQSTLAEDSLS